MSTAPRPAGDPGPAPFHLSFWVADLERSLAFYEGVLGCPAGREDPRWSNVDLFGHQVTLHQAGRALVPAADLGASGHLLDHFGLDLEREAWRALARRLEAAGARFRVRPRTERTGTPEERGKFVVVDPDGIGLEFKWTAAAEGDRPDR